MKQKSKTKVASIAKGEMGSNRYLPYLMFLALIIEEMASDIFLPSLPTMNNYFGVDTSVSQLTVSLYLFGLAISRPLYGTLSDSYGRRPTLLLGMSIFLMGSLFCFLSDSINVLVASRFIQGFGAGVAIVIGFAAVKDIYPSKKGAKILSIMSSILGFSPALAPILGGYMYWRTTFLFILVILSVALVLLLVFMPETLSIKRRAPLNLKQAKSNYAYVLTHKPFMSFVMIQAFTVSALWGWIAGIPDLYIDVIGVAKSSFPYYAAISVFSFMVGARVNVYLLEKYNLTKIIKMGIMICIVTEVLMMAMTKLGYTNDPLLIQVINFPMGFGIAFILSNTTSLALDRLEHSRGAGASIIGTIQMSLGAISSYMVGLLENGTMMPISSVMLVSSLLSGLAYYMTRKIRKQ